MERGSRAPLSPNEQRALARIATGFSPRSLLPAHDVAQLEKLGLIHTIDDWLELTAIGRDRYRQVTGAIAPDSSPEEINAALLNFFSGARR